ncbi:Interactor of constitutive active rops [Thalictrum thalictroides]|uniref:Interactor of constitutive active rops n=1 Tax=Thalictrum thalictroides TaxID=46969 RepID=A0A7J6WXA8_THATH|nr:Interactor of constitutive active rops [Thalictrum thalictroides]
MPRSRERVLEVPHRQPSKASLQLRTSSSDSEPLHQRPIVDRSSPKLGDRRSPRGSQSDSLHQKKLGPRVADLESQLGQAQEELKKLKNQLASTEAAKKEAQEELGKKKKDPDVPENEEEQALAAPPPPAEIQEINQKNNSGPIESPDDNSCETDVFEVPMATVLDKNITVPGKVNEHEDNESKIVEKSPEAVPSEIEKPSLEDIILLKDEMTSLKSKLEEKDKEVELLQVENAILTTKLIELEAEVTSARVKEEEGELKLSQTGVELEATKVSVARLSQELEAVVKVKDTLESEMKTMKVQTEQWRKAADAAAAVLSGGIDMNAKFTGRCGSMDKHVVSGSVFELPGAYTGYEGSPLMNDDLDDRYGNGKRKGSGIRMFGDLWKKKGQK